MVRMQLRDQSGMEEDSPSPLRTSLAWDQTRQPRRGILKHKPPSQRRQPQFLTIPPLQDILDGLSLAETPDPLTVKASKLYGTRYESCHHYNVSTTITMRYGLSSQRITRLREHQALISFMDIYDLPQLLKEVIHQQESNLMEDFFCNAYWAVCMTNTIAELVFEKLDINLDDDITYNPSSDLSRSVKSIQETTHILKNQISVCDWLTTTIGPNYMAGNVPHQIGPLLSKELKKLHSVLTTANDMWVEHAVKVLC